jgi:hypothetical protein
MITGFNQDVTYKGKVYHVQTEDRGKSNPVIETLIYVGGEILASRRTSYEELLQDGYEESKLAALLEQQHRRVVVDIKLGKYAKEPGQSFGEGIISSRSLDEVILEYLTSETENEKLSVAILDQSPLVAGEKAWIHLRVLTDVTQSPIQGALVVIRLASTNGQSQDLFSGKTGGEGLCSATFDIPALSGNAVILTEVTHEKGNYQNKTLVTKGRS